MIRLLRLLIPLLLLSGCMATDNPVPPERLSALAGAWYQVDGNSSIHFYPDETVKLTMPDEEPTVRLLSSLEVIKDDQIGFGVGDRWHGPVHVELIDGGRQLKLIFPGEVKREMIFHRKAP